ncbi:collagen alpha-1(I) chain-like isoform X1 [Lethenteron reissneri]|uniref:collagen alpha-1(I) chain-like isoform X1 n=2 Tax=Lethenteron reissneri TaxID=7753 RepID=UPI002AB74264|nr:collagen alpha-1(I) chain-like isoform X1 [Lethenteron reissneri]
MRAKNHERSQEEEDDDDGHYHYFICLAFRGCRLQRLQRPRRWKTSCGATETSCGVAGWQQDRPAGTFKRPSPGSPTLHPKHPRMRNLRLVTCLPIALLLAITAGAQQQQPPDDRCPCPREEGTRGERGFPGSSGPPGPTGLMGPAGSSGFPGERGDPGRQGPMGPKGDQGFPGVPGFMGGDGTPVRRST